MYANGTAWDKGLCNVVIMVSGNNVFVSRRQTPFCVEIFWLKFKSRILLLFVATTTTMRYVATGYRSMRTDILAFLKLLV